MLALESTPAFATKPLKAQLCRGRVPCKVAKVYPAGKTRNGQPIRVIELNIGRKNPDGGPGCRPFRREIWRVIGPANRVGVLRLMTLCNNGYGAAGVGDDKIRVTANRLVHHQYGGSNWRWDVKRTVSLDPVRVLREESCSFHTISVGFDMTFWDWRNFRGRQIMKFKPGKDGDDVGCVPKQATHRFPLIPHFGKGIGLAPKAAPALGSCALEVRADGGRGYILRGRKVAAGQGASLRVLALGDDTLLITVEDTAFSGGKGWRDSDHVQVWQGGYMSIDADQLHDTPVRMFAVRAADGKPFLGHGKTKARPDVVFHKVTRRPGGVTLRLRLKMPRKLRSLTVAYGKIKAGKLLRLTATSKLRPGSATTLGAAHILRHGGAWCAVKNGRLEAINRGNRVILKPE